MKAVICTGYGGPGVLQIRDVKTPIPKSREIRIRVRAVSVTSSDCITRSFDLPPAMRIPSRLALGMRRPRKPILGMVLSGVVDMIGSRVTQFKVEDKVYAHTFTRFGAYAEYTCIPEDCAVTKMPSNLTFEEATAIPYGGTLALYYLNKLGLSKGQKILVYGASGSVGTSAVQLAVYYGARVTGVCSAANSGMVKSLGALDVIDYTKGKITEYTNRYDLIFDAVGRKKSSHIHFKILLNQSGKFISVDDGSPGTHAVNRENMLILKELAETGFLRPVIDGIFPLEQIREVHAYTDRGHKKGDVIVII